MGYGQTIVKADSAYWHYIEIQFAVAKKNPDWWNMLIQNIQTGLRWKPSQEEELDYENSEI